MALFGAAIRALVQLFQHSLKAIFWYRTVAGQQQLLEITILLADARRPTKIRPGDLFSPQEPKLFGAVHRIDSFVI